jgi:hypothetical protein
MIWAVAWFKDVRRAIAIHLLMNLLGVVTFAAVVSTG